jgi:hypothetical protein
MRVCALCSLKRTCTPHAHCHVTGPAPCTLIALVLVAAWGYNGRWLDGSNIGFTNIPTIYGLLHSTSNLRLNGLYMDSSARVRGAEHDRHLSAREAKTIGSTRLLARAIEEHIASWKPSSKQTELTQ